MTEAPRPVPDVAARPDGRVAVPRYGRGALTGGIVHFGVGGFHRAHQAMYLDRLLNAGGAGDWAITGAGIMPADARMRDVLARQQGLYTLVLKHPDGHQEAAVIGSIVGFLYGPDDPERLLERLAAPETRIVSLTITEGGYNIHAVTGEFDTADPAVRHDLTPGATPTTVFGYVVEALRRRRDRGIPAFTVMSCDNVQGNGRVARRAFTSFARLVDPGLADWMDAHVRFPSSMVDRITPMTTPEDVTTVENAFGVLDAWPVVAEPFVQWVLEDDFADGRPPYERAGVQIVPDIEPYELMKLRLLNGSHQALAYVGALAGYRYAHDAAQNPLIAAFLRRYMLDEASPTLRPVPGIDLATYRASLLERFCNAHVRDTVARLAAETSDRIPKFLLPVVADQLAASRQVTFSAVVVAAWARYARGIADDGSAVTVVDRLADQVTAVARDPDPLAFLRQRDLFGDLVDDERFVRPYLWAHDSLARYGAMGTLEHLVTSA